MKYLNINESTPGKFFQEIIETPPGFRLFILGKKENQIDYSVRDGSDSMNFSIRSKEQDIIQKILPDKKVAILNQVHGNTVCEVNEKGFSNVAQTNGNVYAEGDGMVSMDRNIAMVIVTADCLPLFFVDHNKGVFGAAHAGWQGSRKGIAQRVFKKMINDYNSQPGDIRIFFLPGISPNFYEIKEDVARFFPNFLFKKKNKIYLDLVNANISQLVNEGALRENILVSSYCTYENNDRFFSHRKGDPGRNLNVIQSI